MQKYKSNITTTSGAAVRNVPVHVLAEDGSPASIFLDRAGTAQAANPLSTASDGTFYFYAENGRYSLRTTVDGVTITDADVALLWDPAEVLLSGPLAEAVERAEASAAQAEAAVADSGIVDLVASAQNAVVDAQLALAEASGFGQSAQEAKDAAASAVLASQVATDAANLAVDAAQDAILASAATIKAYATHAEAEAAIAAALLPDGADAEVSQDETRAGARTRYKVQAGALVFVVNLDQVRLDLAGADGVQLVGNAVDARALAAASGSGMVGYFPAGVGAVGRSVQSKLREVQSLKDFGASTTGSAADNSVAVTAALSWMSANNGRVLVDGLYTINGDLPVGANGFHFFGHDKYNDGFIFAPQSAAITGGVHGYFLPNSAIDTKRMVFENLTLKSTYNSGTWAGSTVFAGLRCSPASGITHRDIEFRNCYFYDPSNSMAVMAPQLGGNVKNVKVLNCEADVSSLATSSRIASVIQCIIEYIDFPGHTTSYGLKQISNVQVIGGTGRGWRTFADLKRGTNKFVVDGVITENMSDCHHSVDGSFFGSIVNVTGSQSSALPPTKNFIEVQGEDITVANWKYNGTLGLGSLAAVMVTNYAYPTESATAYHQSKRVRVLDGNASGVNQNAVRLIDTVDCSVSGLSVGSVTGSGVSIEHPAAAPNGGANAAIPANNTVDGVAGHGTLGVYAVSNATKAQRTKIGKLSGFLGQVTGNIAYTPMHPDNANPNRSMDVVAGVVQGWSLSPSATAAVSADCPPWATQSVLINGANAAALDLLSLGNRIRVNPGDVISVRATVKLGTATAAGIQFQEMDAAGGFLSNSFQNVPAVSGGHTENIIYHTVTGASCAMVRISLMPNTNYNDPASIGTSYWSDVVISKGAA